MTVMSNTAGLKNMYVRVGPSARRALKLLVAGTTDRTGTEGLTQEEFVAAQKRRPVEEGAVLGALFGPLGCLIEACLPVGDVRPPTRPAARPRPKPKPFPSPSPSVDRDEDLAAEYLR